jgi:hypothetical protein
MCGNKGSPPTPSAASTAQSGTTAQTGYSQSSGATQADPFAAALYRNYLGTTAQDLRNQPMTPEQLSAASNLYSLGMQAGTFDPTQIANIESPYIGDVVSKTQEAFRNANRIQANDLISSAIRSGNAFGGDRMGVAEAALAGQQQTAQAPIIAGLYQSGYGQALDEYNRLKQMGLSGAGQAVAGANITGNRPFELANWYASQIGGLGPLLGSSTQQQGQQGQQGSYIGYYTPPQPNPWVQGIGLGLTGLGGLGFGSDAGSPLISSASSPLGYDPSGNIATAENAFPYGARRGGLVPRRPQRFQAGGLSMPSDIIAPSEMHDITPLQLATRGLPAANINMPGLSPMHVPEARQSTQGSSGSSGSSGGNFWSDVGNVAMKALPFAMAFLARGGSLDDVSDRGLASVMPRGFYGPSEQLPSTPDEFREKYGRDPATDHELEHYFGPRGSPLQHLERPRHFQVGGESVPGLEGMTRGLFTPVSARADESVQPDDGPDAQPTIIPTSLRMPGIGRFPIPREARPAAEPRPVTAAYAPGTESEISGLGIRQPTGMQSWATNPLTQAGLAMMSTRSPNLLTGVGEGMRGAQSALQQQRAAEVALDTPHKMLTDGPTVRYQMGDGRIVDTKIPNPGYESPEAAAEGEQKKTIAKMLEKGYEYDPKTKTMKIVPGGPADPNAVAAKERAKAEGKYGVPTTIETPQGSVPSTSAGRVLRINAALGDDYDHRSETGGNSFDYTQGSPGDIEKIEKGDSIPAPTKVGTLSIAGLKTAAEQYLLEGKKALPDFKGSRANQNDVKAYNALTTAIRNYAIAMGQSRGLSEQEIAEAMRFGARGSDIRWKLSVDGRQAIALGTAMRHLATLNQLYDAWDPSVGGWNIQALSKIKARVAAQFGDAAVTNINTAVSMIGPEIVKALGVAGAGTEADRDEMKNNFSLESSDAQRRGAVATAIRLMGGKLPGNRAQADSVGVKEKDYAKIVGEEQYEQMKKIMEGEKTGTDKSEKQPEEGSAAAARALGLPSNSAYNFGRKQWKSPDGTIYDQKGKVVSSPPRQGI